MSPHLIPAGTALHLAEEAQRGPIHLSDKNGDEIAVVMSAASYHRLVRKAHPRRQLDRDKTPRYREFSEKTLAGAMYLIYALANDLKESDPDVLPTQLRQAVGDPDHLGLVTAGYLAVRATPDATLTAARYDEERASLVGEDDFNHAVWPPTSQTLIKRSGGFWNNALEEAGLKPSSMGRARSYLKYSQADALAALTRFDRWAEQNNISSTYDAYCQWASDDKRKGQVPTGPTLRQKFGSWTQAAKKAGI